MNLGTLGALEVVVVQNSGCGFFFEVPDQKGTNSAKKFFFVFQQEMNHILTTDFQKICSFFFLRGGWGNWKIQRKYSANINQEQTATEIFFLIIFFDFTVSTRIYDYWRNILGQQQFPDM